MNNEYRLNAELIKHIEEVTGTPAAVVMERSGIPRSTWYAIKTNVENISVQQLLAIANALCIPIKRFFYTGDTQVVGLQGDYVVAPYKACYYSDEAMQAFVDGCQTATWKKASEIIGMTRSRLRDSMLAVRRTPVLRFLEVCRAFDVDPFTILIDPNTDCHASAPKAEDAKDSIAELHKQIADLSSTVGTLESKYQSLLKRFNKMERDVRDYLGLDYRNLSAAEDDD